LDKIQILATQAGPRKQLQMPEKPLFSAISLLYARFQVCLQKLLLFQIIIIIPKCVMEEQRSMQCEATL
jgi:hypothetical protein